MKAMPYSGVLALSVLLGLLLSSCGVRLVAEPFVTGLNLPRGLIFDDEGNLIVTEAGARVTGISNGSLNYTNHSGRVLSITPGREITTLASGLPFAYLPDLATGVGATDIAITHGAVYVLTGEGPDPLARSVLRVTPGQPPALVASILNFAAVGTPRDLVAKGFVRANPYAMVAAPHGDVLYVSDGASGRVLRITLDGTISVYAELPASPPLTGLAFGPDGKLYFAAFSPLPHTQGSGTIWAADAVGRLSVVAERLTMPIDVAFNETGSMYLLEFSNGRRPENPYTAGGGRVLHIDNDGSRTVVIDHLNYPTAMAFSRIGDLYIAVGGAFTGLRQGSILRVPCLALSPLTTCSAQFKS